MAVNLQGTGQQRRIAWLVAVFAAIGLVLLGRLVWWQLLPNDELIALSLSDMDRPNTIPAARGCILDANGQYLVASTVQYRVAVSPKLLAPWQREQLTPQVAAILGLPEAEVAETLARTNTEYAVLGDDYSVWVAQQIEDLDVSAFSLEARFRRVYPDGALAASVVGFVDLQGQPQYGLERYYDRQLRGEDGVWRGITDSWGEPIMMAQGGYRPARDGTDLVSTLDRNVQYAAENILRDGIERYKAEAGNIIVMDPRTGAIVAMADYPSYAPGEYWRVESLEQYVNTAVSALYEPGSVFKPLTLAAGLEARVIRPTDSYDDRGEIIVGNQRIRNADRRAHGPTTMTELLAYSRNVGAAHVAAMLGPTRFYEIIRRFGFGEVTGIDLMHEVPGIMRVPGNPAWHMSDLGTNAFGQGISVTPIQVVAAYGAIANDGVLMRPYVVAEVHDGAHVERREPFRVRRVLSSEVAQQLVEIMADATAMGMQQATVPGYRLAGKSGTAGIPDAEGYENADVIASYVGFGPVPDPRFVILVRFDKPQRGEWGIEVAAPAFAEMAKFLVDYYGIPPTAG
ncbi:MAG TPA: penicillin-binding protein 2 [Chloroflexi bacterium]|jgi:cell division protein FtsI (penicillin-binding protein 3)|nr:penicillin-binding protein 2 [Chloroflexota bacterium]